MNLLILSASIDLMLLLLRKRGFMKWSLLPALSARLQGTACLTIHDLIALGVVRESLSWTP